MLLRCSRVLVGSAVLSLLAACGGGSSQGAPPSGAGDASSLHDGGHVEHGDAEAGTTDQDGGKTIPLSLEAGTPSSQDGGPHVNPSPEGGTTSSSLDAGDSASGHGHEGGGATEAGSHLDASAVSEASTLADSSTNPLDPSSCTGSPMTMQQAVAYFAMGATTATLGSYTTYVQQRSCDTVTGCTAWSTSEWWYSTLNQFSNPVDVTTQEGETGTVALVVSGTDIDLELNSTGPLSGYTGATCGSVLASTVSCGSLVVQTEYTYGLQGGGTATAAANDPVYAGPVPADDDELSGQPVTFSGVVTDHCARLTYGVGANSEFQAILYASW